MGALQVDLTRREPKLLVVLVSSAEKERKTSKS